VVAVIVGRTEMLGSGMLGPLNEGQQRSVDILAAAVERLATELDDLGDLLDAPPGSSD